MCIRMMRIPVKIRPIGDLHDLPQIHHRDPLREMPHHGQIMRDEDKGDAKLPLQPL